MGQASATEVASQGKLTDEGRYEVQAEIAAGGMGAVYRVFDRVAGEVRALKRARLDGEMRRFAIEALEREYQVLASLDHPRIIRVFDYGVDDRGPFYTMELLEGQDLRRAAPLPFRAACMYLRDIATSLALLHGRRLIHRDLSPSNVRLTPDGHCKLLDFGALTGFGVASRLVGTPQLADFFAAISAHRPLAIVVDNAEEADDASHGLLASLASIAPQHPLLLVVSEVHLHDAAQRGIGSQALRRYAHCIELKELSRSAMHDLARSIFSDGPNLERFVEWLHERSAGSPLFAIEICRRLLGKGVLRYVNGLWILPAERPDAELPSALGDALSIRIGSLQADARTLAERLSLQRDQPTLHLCTLLCADSPEPAVRVRELLEELIRAGVLVADRGNFRFSSSRAPTTRRCTSKLVSTSSKGMTKCAAQI